MTEFESDSPAFRHSAREAALQALYALDLRRRKSRAGDAEESEPAEPSEVFDAVLENFEMPVAAQEFAREIVMNVSEGLEKIDAILVAHTKNWRVERMAVVDRNILRIGAWELRHSETPAPVVLDEAVELARRFGSDPSPAFVNGVLDAVARELRGES